MPWEVVARAESDRVNGMSDSMVNHVIYIDIFVQSLLTYKLGQTVQCHSSKYGRRRLLDRLLMEVELALPQRNVR